MGRAGKVAAAWAAAGTLLLALPGAALASPPGRPPGSSLRGPVRVVSYLGYQVRVPASWPVYRLAADPSRCVLFNRHAVYLGRPGADQRCPVRAFGRTESLLVQPLGSLASLPPGTVVQRGQAAVRPAGTVALTDAASHTLSVALPAAGVQVTAAYGSDLALVRGILDSARVTQAAPSASTRVPSSRAAGRAGGTGTAAPATGRPVPARGMTGSRSPAAGRSAAAATLTGGRGSGLGFDACTAPSVATMTAWLASPFRVAGTYLGGANWACSYGNFTPSWVSQVAAMGWRFVPVWVGPQAPCSTIPGAVLINPSQAAAQGKSEAASAVSTAAGFGYGTGTPVYFDMEGYDNSQASCKQAVLNFLAGWTQGLHAAGYVSGVYSSAASGVADLASQYGTGYASPDDIWIADWTGDPVLADPYVPAGDWASHQRLHQYYGGHTETWGGVSVNIDADVIDGAVAGLSSAPKPPASFAAGQPDAAAVAPGSAAIVQLAVGTRANHAAATVNWQVHAPAGLTVSPSSGATFAPAGSRTLVKLTVTAASSAAQGRYDLPVTAAAGSEQLTETFELVSVVPAGQTLPTAKPVVLYAADTGSMAVAVKIAHRLALPAADVTGRFTTAWNDLAGGKDLLLAVGQAALNGLYYNPCGWSNPAGTGAGSTPFSYVGAPARQPPGTNYFENSSASSTTQTSQLTGDLTHYALAGTLPDEGTLPPGPAAPAQTCLGSPSVAVP
jgi:Rv2525c-like, glycoside hydrolase-like domain